MLTINIPPHLENLLNTLAKEQGQTKDYLICSILESYFEDRENALSADKAYAEFLENGKKTISLSEMESRLKFEK